MLLQFLYQIGDKGSALFSNKRSVFCKKICEYKIFLIPLQPKKHKIECIMVEDRREKILLKAIELYMIEGYANVSITDLQAALNMGRGTLYYYFKDKEELFQEAVSMYLIQPKQRALNRVKDTDAIPEMIEAMLYYINQLQANSKLLYFSTITHNPFDLSPFSQTLFHNLIHQYYTIFYIPLFVLYCFISSFFI